MRLAMAAARFDRTPCRDGYSGQMLFNAQLGLYDDNKRDSETAERRILSMSFRNVIPPRRVLDVLGTKFIVGHANTDTFGPQSLRVGYTVHEGTHLATVRTLAQACANAGGFTAWAGRAWVKNDAFTQQGSQLAGEYHIHFAANEPVPDGALIAFDGRQYVARAANSSPGGMLVVTADEMPEPCIETALIATGTYDALTESLVGSDVSAQVVRMRWQSNFQYLNKSAPSFGPDDIQVAVGLSVGVKVGSTMTLSDGTWQVASITQTYGVQLCRATKHGA